MSCLWCFFSVFLSTLTIINSQGYYAIIAPNTIRPNSEYHVAVSIHKSSEPSSVKIGIISSSYSDFKAVEVRPYSTELVQFEFKDLKPEKYSLTAEGITGVIFTNETILRFQPKQLSVLIQTDKSIYKPEDKVRFRVLILDSNLKPAKDYGQINVNVRDADKNRIIHLKDISLTSSIYSEEFELASSPVLGEWTIHVEAMGETYIKTFEVLEYILPNFEVSIETKKHAVYKDGTIAATVRAKYPFGKPIKGEATVSIYPIFNGSLQPFITNLITRKVVPIDGKAFVEFEIIDELKFNEDYQRDIIIEATVEEKLTGQKQNTTTIVTIHRDRYIIEIVRMPLYYIPNVPFDVTIKMVQHDGTPLKDDINPITAYLTRSYSSDEMYNKTDYRLDNNGMAKLNFMVGDEDKDVSHSLIISYLGTSTDIGTVFRKQHRNDVFIQAELLTENPSVNEEINVAVKSNQKMKYFIYQIIGRGDVLLSKAVDVPDSNYQTFKFLATFAMVPKAKLLVHFVQDGDFIYDEQTIDFGEELANNINLESPNRVSPGQDVDITITTKPYCYIGLLAIDQRAFELRTGHDITKATVLDELMKYDSETSRLIPGGSPGQDAGLVTLTNTDYHTEMPITQSTPSTFDEDDGKITTAKKTDIGPAHTFEVNTRPPLAGPYAFSRIPKPLWTRPRINVMTEIMDTWLFMNISSGKEGRTTVHKKIPNAMTSWMLTGFSLDPVTGLGISKIPKTIQVFQPFYITTDLPYSIKLGEIVSLSFIVFNNMDKDLDVKVTLFNTAQEFDFIQVNNQVDDSPKIELYNRRLLNIPENTEKSVSFIIRPKKLGPIEIKASADSPVASDTVQKLLLVEPEGATEYLYEGLLIDLRSKPDQQDNVTLEIPRNVIPDSVHIEVSVVGDIVGPSVLNLDNLIRLPYACGEQNIAHFVPNILVLRYLEKLGRLSPAVEAMAMKHLELGYQQTLSYKRHGGSFSVFGNLDKNGSTWLTAYVAKSFRQAAEYTEIDEEIIKIALSYLARMQAPNGSFLEFAQPIHDYFSYEIDGGISLTAFTVLAFLENANNIADYRNTINKALDFIVRGLDSSENVFSLAIGVYALQTAGHNAKDVFIPKLDAKARSENGKKWWELEVPESDRRSPWYNNSRTLNIQATSYVALAYLKNNLVSDTFPIIKWLIDQRNINGGFSSSYDTVVGLEALVEFSEMLTPTVNNNIQVVFGYSQDEEYRINVHQDNTLAILSKEIPSLTRDIKVISSGRGIALAQVAYRYNTNVTLAWPRFTLDPQVNRISRDSTDYLQLSICTSFTPAVGEDEKSNMAVMEVGFPSGFTVDLDTIPSLESKERIMKVETKKRNTKVIIYFDFLNRTEICPTIDAYKTHKVTKHKQASVIIYDYYDNTRKARMFYYAPKSTLCDICEPDTCSDSCKERAEERSQLNGDTESGSGFWFAPSIYVLLISSIIVKILP